MKRQIIVNSSSRYLNQDAAGDDGPNLDTSFDFGNSGMSCNGGNYTDIFGSGSTSNVRVPEYIAPTYQNRDLVTVNSTAPIVQDIETPFTMISSDWDALIKQAGTQPACNNADDDNTKSPTCSIAKDAAALAALFKPAAPVAATGAAQAVNAAGTPAPAASTTPWGTIAIVVGAGLLLVTTIIIVANRT